MSLRWPRSLFFFFLTCLLASKSVCAQAGPATNGWLDLRGTSLSDEMISLEGEWEFYPNQFIPPKTIGQQPNALALFPSVWKKRDSIDRATYRLRLIVSENLLSKTLSLAVPSVFSSYSLWINGALAGTQGTPAESAAATVPYARPALYTFTVPNDTIEVIVQMANFHHSTGGCKQPFFIGETERMKAWKTAIERTDYILFIGLFLIALISLCFFYIRKANRSPFLYLSLFVLVWLIRSLCSNEYRLLDWVEVPWRWMMRVEYLGIHLSTLMALLFLSSLFPRDFDSKILKLFFILTCGMFSVFTMFTEPVVFTQYLWLYVSVSTCLIFYVIFIICKAFIYERAGATIMLVSILLGAMAFGYVILDYINFIVINVVAYNLSFMILFGLLTYSMSVRLSKMNVVNESETLTLDHFFNDRNV